jgi:hypothetical protein
LGLLGAAVGGTLDYRGIVANAPILAIRNRLPI